MFITVHHVIYDFSPCLSVTLPALTAHDQQRETTNNNLTHLQTHNKTTVTCTGNFYLC